MSSSNSDDESSSSSSYDEDDDEVVVVSSIKTETNGSGRESLRDVWYQLTSADLKGSIVKGDIKSVDDNFKVGGVLGSGAYGEVVYARRTSDAQEVALKRIPKQRLPPFSKRRLNVQREVALLKRLKHPNIVELFEVIETKEEVILVMEYASGGMLFNQLANEHYYGFKEEVASKMVYRILEAVQFMHIQGIAHRDLKPENILLMGDEINPDQIKICDFGFATWNEDPTRQNTLMKSYCGTPGYMAPEVVEAAKGNGYNAKADIYSIGCITFILLTGDLPFDDDSYSEIERQTLEDELVFDPLQWKGLRTAQSFVEQCLNRDPDLRPTAAEALKHRWFSGWNKKESADLQHVPTKLQENGGIKGLMQRLKERRKNRESRRDKK